MDLLLFSLSKKTSNKGKTMSTSIENRRNKEEAIPDNVDLLLNEKQKATIKELIALDWYIWFVRRPKFQPVIPVLFDTKSDKIAMIDEDGIILEEPIIRVRGK